MIPKSPKEMGAIRTIDYLLQKDPMWNPPHLPPKCQTCRGLGYTRAGELAEWTACKDCKGRGAIEGGKR